MSGKRKDRSFTQTDVFGAMCGQQPRIGAEEKAKIRRLSSAGASLEHIAAAWEVQLDEVKQILEECSSSEGVGDEVVKRLLKDPEELCCPVSHQLMADPVVAADGLTYERSWVEECLRTAPHKSPTTGEAMSTTVLLPNQTVKSMILSFKEQTVNEILFLMPRLAKHQVPELAKRGEDFVRPLPDASAKKKLAQLLLMRVKHGTGCGEAAKELVALLLEAEDEENDGCLEEAVALMKEADLQALLSSVDEDTVRELHDAAPSNGLVQLELAKRLASRLTDRRLKSLWSLMEVNMNHESWMQAAACLLAVHLSRLDLPLSDLPSDLLMKVASFLDDQEAATAVALDFFNYDLGISSTLWPPTSTACIFQELAMRAETSQDRLQLLLKGHCIDEALGDAVAQQLQHMLRAGEGDQEGLFLKLALKEGQDLPLDVLPKLTLEERHLSQVLPQQLMLLARQLGKHGRRADGAQLAVLAAKRFAAAGQGPDCENAYLQAFSLDHSIQEAAHAVATALTSTRERCQQLEESHDELEQRCQQLEASHRELEAKSCLLSVVWDLSDYNFSSFTKGQMQRSEKFQLPRGINAWMTLYPKGHRASSKGKAGLCLLIDKPAVVKWTWQSGSSEPWTEECDFSEDPNWDGTPSYGYGWPDFMPSSEANDRITLRIISVRLLGSSLCFS